MKKSKHRPKRKSSHSPEYELLDIALTLCAINHKGSPRDYFFDAKQLLAEADEWINRDNEPASHPWGLGEPITPDFLDSPISYLKGIPGLTGLTFPQLLTHLPDKKGQRAKKNARTRLGQTTMRGLQRFITRVFPNRAKKIIDAKSVTFKDLKVLEEHKRKADMIRGQRSTKSRKG